MFAMCIVRHRHVSFGMQPPHLDLWSRVKRDPHYIIGRAAHRNGPAHTVKPTKLIPPHHMAFTYFQELVFREIR